MIAVVLVFAALLLVVADRLPDAAQLGGHRRRVAGRADAKPKAESWLRRPRRFLRRSSALSAPDRVAEQAAQLGLGPAESVHYVQRRDSAASGG